MKKLVFLLLFCSLNAFAETDEIVLTLSPVEVHGLFREQYLLPDITTLPDVVDKEEKISSCVVEYKEKQSKSYGKIVQNNLYDLIHNFDNIASRIRGKKPQTDDTPFEEKIEALARLHCEAYYAIKVLK